MSQPNRNVKSAKTEAAATRTFGIPFPLVLAILLAILFGKSFLPGYVHFSNDGPLGQQQAAEGRYTVTGSWWDLSDIGSGGGGVSPDFSQFAHWLLGPVGFAKFFAPIALFVMGIGAWTFFRQLKLSLLAAALGSLAVTLNSAFFGNACWGTSPQQVAIGMVFFALALVMANSEEMPRPVRWTRLALAGMAVGVSVMEGADNGAIFSLVIAAYVSYKSFAEVNASVLQRIGCGIGHVAIIAFFAGFLADGTISSLVGSNITGVAGMGEQKTDQEKLEHWDWATEWSLPKKETLGLFVPGVFGYRMDTPKDMMDFLKDSYTGGEYWGGMGRTPTIDRYFDSGQTDSPPSGMMRFGYAGFYAGILVAMVALFAILQSFRRQNSIFPLMQQRLIWFWTAALVIGLLLAWGRFAPFYYCIYVLPYFSTIRNPVKFTSVFYLAMVIIFAYGIDGLSRCYLQVPKDKFTGKSLWANLRGFNRNWSFFCLGLFALGLVGWLFYSGQEAAMIVYLQRVGFSDADTAKQIFSFSVGQVGIFVIYLAAAVGLFILVLAGFFSGKRAWVGGLLLGAFVVADMARADLPWIIHWDYKQKYASNPIIDFLRDKPYEHRVTDLPSGSLFEQLYRIEWMQHHFPYYGIQCSEVIQLPRVGSDVAAYEGALTPTSVDDEYLLTRHWQLTNTRYLFAPANYLESMDEQLDPAQRRFDIVQRFNVVPKPGIEQPTELEQVTAVPDPNGEYALFEFTGALPRVKLYSNWQVNTNNETTLKTLSARDFDPQQTVLVSMPLPGEPAVSSKTNTGTVDFTSYAPKDIVFSAKADQPSVLLFNDKYDAGWKVSVDGKPADLLRCDFIMRGVFLQPGDHTVEFQFLPPARPVYVTLLAMGLGFLLCGFLFISTRRPPAGAAPIQALPKEGRASAGNRKASSEPARPASH